MGTSSSPATDIWAFGLIAFFLLTGRSYWLAVERDGTQVELFAKILSLPLPAASARARELGVSLPLSPQFDAWFSRCVNREVSLRFRSAGLAASELPSALGVAAHPSRTTGPAAGLETLAHGAFTSARSSTPRARARAVLSTLGVVLIGAGGAAATLVWKGGGPSETEPSPSARAAGASPAPSRPSAPTTPDASSSPTAATVVSAVGAASAPARVGGAAGATGSKRPARLPPAASKDLPKPTIRDVYERR
jgi:eukaryotic-like serine/threonine-protein kinase